MKVTSIVCYKRQLMNRLGHQLLLSPPQVSSSPLQSLNRGSWLTKPQLSSVVLKVSTGVAGWLGHSCCSHLLRPEVSCSL